MVSSTISLCTSLSNRPLNKFRSLRRGASAISRNPINDVTKGYEARSRNLVDLNRA